MPASRTAVSGRRLAIAAALLPLLCGGWAMAQAQNQPQAQDQPQESDPATAQPSAQIEIDEGTLTGRLLHQPISGLLPGGGSPKTDLQNPVASDPGAAEQGRLYFNSFNCSGCHAPNGGGGMGPSLSNRTFIYGSKPADIYLSILQGRPNGMPAWGDMLPDQVIWYLVTYIDSISREPEIWGTTVSASPMRPSIEQVPAEFLTTTTPWQNTNQFSAGQRPFEKPKRPKE